MNANISCEAQNSTTEPTTNPTINPTMPTTDSNEDVVDEQQSTKKPESGENTNEKTKNESFPFILVLMASIFLFLCIVGCIVFVCFRRQEDSKFDDGGKDDRVIDESSKNVH